jgi:predicted DNA-binding transcriptional regulator YafY
MSIDAKDKARKPTPFVQQTGRMALRQLRTEQAGATKEELAQRCGPGGSAVSVPTMQRALDWLRDGADAPIHYDRATGRWKLEDPGFHLPLEDPTADDLVAVMIAGALLEPHGDTELAARVQRLVEQLDDRVPRDPGTARVRPGAVVATVTTVASAEATVLLALIRAVGRQVLRVRYASPWAPLDAGERTHELEPWQVRVHDGAAYLRAWSRGVKGPRSFRVAHVRGVQVIEGATPEQPVPPADEIWSEGDPAFGIDSDRPDVARVRVRGPLARWLAEVRWHDKQDDHWLVEGELLEREVPYRSCREFARRLLSLGAGVEAIEPAALREEVQRHAQALLAALGPAPAGEAGPGGAPAVPASA